MKKHTFFLFLPLWILLSMAFMQCTPDTLAADEEPLPCDQEAVLVNLRGLSGCGWAIRLPSGDHLEPFSYRGESFTAAFAETPGLELVEGQRFRFSYVALEDVASNCMVGTIVEVTCLGATTSTTD